MEITKEEVDIIISKLEKKIQQALYDKDDAISELRKQINALKAEMEIIKKNRN
jgi:hypothetical protein